MVFDNLSNGKHLPNIYDRRQHHLRLLRTMWQMRRKFHLQFCYQIAGLVKSIALPKLIKDLFRQYEWDPPGSSRSWQCTSPSICDYHFHSTAPYRICTSHLTYMRLIRDNWCLQIQSFYVTSFFHVCKHLSPCDITMSWRHVDINCNSLRFTVRKLSISENIVDHTDTKKSRRSQLKEFVDHKWSVYYKVSGVKKTSLKVQIYSTL